MAVERTAERDLPKVRIIKGPGWSSTTSSEWVRRDLPEIARECSVIAEADDDDSREMVKRLLGFLKRQDGLWELEIGGPFTVCIGDAAGREALRDVYAAMIDLAKECDQAIRR